MTLQHFLNQPVFPNRHPMMGGMMTYGEIQAWRTNRTTWGDVIYSLKILACVVAFFVFLWSVSR